MPNIIEISDCIGSADVQKGTFTTPKFDSIRDEFSDDYIYKLLGVTLGDLFLADLDVNGVPQNEPYITIYNPIKMDLDNGGILDSKGIKYYIKMIVWFYYARNNDIDIALSGNKVSLSENSDNLIDPTALVKNYNKGIRTARAIQCYIEDNLTTFADYNGQYIPFALPLL